MKVLITGVAGFIGSHLAERFLGLGCEVCGIDNLDSFYDPAIKRANLEFLSQKGLSQKGLFRFCQGDIRDRDFLESIVGDGSFEAVVHLAARAGVRPSVEDPSTYIDVNLRGTVEVLEAMRTHDVKKFVFASSSSVYGSRADSPFREDDNVDVPASPYAATKKAGELLCATYNYLYGTATTCLRFFTVYGPRQRPEMAIHKFIRNIASGAPVTIYGDGSARRDFTYVDDIIDGVVAALETADGYKVYNLGNGQPVEVLELVRLIEKALGKEAVLDLRPEQPGDVPLTCADISKAQNELGYDPSFPLEKGLKESVTWFLQNVSP